MTPRVSWGYARISWCDLQRFQKWLKRFRGYLEEMQGSPDAISRDSENYYILEDSGDILRRCKDLLKRFPEILKTIIYWKIPRISWVGARISWSGFQRFWERRYIGRLHGYPEEMQGSPEAIARDSENDYKTIPRISWRDAKISWSDFQRFRERLHIGRFRGYLEEMQRSPEAISRGSENDYRLEGSEDILRRCKVFLKRFTEILRTTRKRLRGYPEEVQRSPQAASKDSEVLRKIARISWGGATGDP